MITDVHTAPPPPLRGLVAPAVECGRCRAPKCLDCGHQSAPNLARPPAIGLRRGGGGATAGELPSDALWPATPTPAVRSGSPGTHKRRCGTQPADQSMITDVHWPRLLPYATSMFPPSNAGDVARQNALTADIRAPRLAGPGRHRQGRAHARGGRQDRARNRLLPAQRGAAARALRRGRARALGHRERLTLGVGRDHGRGPEPEPQGQRPAEPRPAAASGVERDEAGKGPRARTKASSSGPGGTTPSWRGSSQLRGNSSATALNSGERHMR